MSRALYDDQVIGLPYDSVWADIVLADYYDGPVSGIAVDIASGTFIAFLMVDWDLKCDNRVFAIYILESEQYEMAATLFAGFNTPASASRQYEDGLQQLLGAHRAATCLIGINNRTNTIIGVTQLPISIEISSFTPFSSAPAIPYVDWFPCLNIERG